MIKAFASYLRRLAIVERLFQGGITMKHQRNVKNSFGVVVTEMPTILQQKQNVKSDAKRKPPKTKLMMSLMENRWRRKYAICRKMEEDAEPFWRDIDSIPKPINVKFSNMEVAEAMKIILRISMIAKKLVYWNRILFFHSCAYSA